MTSGDGASPAVRTRVAARLAERLNVGLAAAASGGGTEQTQKLRKVAMLLRGLDAPTRDALLKAIDSNDADAGQAVRDLMVVWADVASVADRTLQNILRLVDARNLALALHGAEPAIAAKINSNISERARALVDEETSLMSSPKQQDVEKARQEMLKAMRELNATGQLEFEEQT
jgi:flagellar motor switch protein FliG